MESFLRDRVKVVSDETAKEIVCKYLASTSWSCIDQAGKYGLVPLKFVRHNARDLQELIFDLAFSDWQLPLIARDTVSLNEDFVIRSSYSRPRSASKFSKENLASDTQIMSFLNDAYGADAKRNNRRRFPSAGAMYPIEVFLVPMIRLDNSRFKFSSYHYRPVAKVLDQVAAIDVPTIDLLRWPTTDSLLKNAQFFITYVLNIEKAIVKYGERGSRMALTEVGAMYQCASEVADIHGFSSRVWGGYEENRLAKHLGLRPTELFPVITQLFGRK